MKRSEFKLLMEDWKRNFVEEDDVVSNTLNEGYSELDYMILEEGIKDTPIYKNAVKIFGVIAISAMVKVGGWKLVQQALDNHVGNNDGTEVSQTFYPQSEEIGEEYRDLDIGNDNLETPINNIENEFIEDFNKSNEKINKQVMTPGSDKNSWDLRKVWLGKNLDKYAEKIADQAKINADSAGKSIPDEVLGSENANNELLNQARKSLLKLVNEKTKSNYSVDNIFPPAG